jgi:hypothetical protein
MLIIRDRAKFEQIFVKARQPRKVIRAEIHMMELELHFIYSFVRWLVLMFAMLKFVCLVFVWHLPASREAAQS